MGGVRLPRVSSAALFPSPWVDRVLQISEEAVHWLHRFLSLFEGSVDGDPFAVDPAGGSETGVVGLWFKRCFFATTCCEMVSPGMLITPVMLQCCKVLSSSLACMEKLVGASAPERTSERIVEHIVGMLVAHIVTIFTAHL